MNSINVTRVAVVISHPIQHFCPQYSEWARLAKIHLKVFFASRNGILPYQDKDFGRTVQWAELILDFPHIFLPGAEGRKVDANIDCNALDAALEEYAPDALIVYGYGQKLQRRAARWGAVQSVPVLMISDSTTHQATSWWKRAVKAVVLPRVYASIGAFLSVGDSNEAYYRRYGVDDTCLVRCPFPIDVRRFDVALKDRDVLRARLRAELGIPDDHLVLLMVGKLVWWKRQCDLIRFSNDCQKRDKRVTVVVVGTGADHEKLSRGALRRGPGGVIFAGFVQPVQLLAYYCASDIYVHCSEREPHSLAISEAIYAGLPVVLSHRCGSYGPTDDVQPGRNGFVYRCGDIEDLSSALAALLQDAALRKSMAEASVEISRSKQRMSHGPALTQGLALIGAGSRRIRRQDLWKLSS